MGWVAAGLGVWPRLGRATSPMPGVLSAAGLLRAHTPLSDGAYYARVYTSRGWASGRQAPSFGPEVILPEAFTPELTPTIFEFLEPAFESWNRNFNGWTQGMANAWMKAAAINVARVWTPGLSGRP